MIVSYDRDDDRRRMIVTVTGPYDLDSALNMVDHIAADDAWSYGILYDTRD